MLEHRSSGVTESGLLEREQRRGRALGRRNLELEGRIDVRRRDALEAAERLEPALGLPRLAGLGTESLDETRDVRDLALLPLEQRLLAGEPGGTLLLERGVVSRIEGEPAILDMGHVRDAAVEELAVVRHHQQRASICSEPALQPHNSIEVEVIGGLVEQQQLGAALQCTREV